MKVLIVEDEKIAVRRLTQLLEELYPGCAIVGSVDTISGAVSWFENNPEPDICFFDIQLADGISFDIFAKTTIACPVIFTTAYDQYALRAFEVNSIDYLLKPVEKEKLERALMKYEKWAGREKETFLDAAVLQEALEMLKGKDYKERFVVKYGDHIKSVLTSEISCFFSEEKATFFVTDDNKKYLVDYTMDQVAGLLDPSKFFRINRKFIVAFHSMKDIVAWSNSRLKLTLQVLDHPDLVVAREKVQEFKKWLDR